MSIELYPSVAKIKRNGVYENLPGFVPEQGSAATQQMIASAENSATAQYVHTKGEYFRLNDTLYQAIVKINVGDSIVVGTNCKVAVIGNDLTKVENSIANFELGTATSVHNKGEYFMINETMYIATSTIEVGDSISTSTNCRLAVIGDELTSQSEAISDLNSAIEYIFNGDELRFDKTISGKRRVEVPVNIPAGTYHLTVDGITSSDTDASTCAMTFVNSSSTGFLLLQLNRTSISQYITLSQDVAQINFFASDSNTHASGDSFSFTNVIIKKVLDFISDLQGALEDEENARSDAEEALQDEIDGINSIIIKKGINLYNPNLQTSETISPHYWYNGEPYSQTTYDNKFNCTAPIAVEGNTQYSLALVPPVGTLGIVKPWNTATQGVFFYDEDGNYISSQYESPTFTTPQNAAYIRFNYYINEGNTVTLSVLNASCMLVKGSTIPETWSGYYYVTIDERVEALEEANTAQNPVWYRRTGTKIEVGYPYSTNKNVIVTMQQFGGNNLFDFKKVETVNSSDPYETGTRTTIFESSTDCFAPYQVGAVNNIDGDDETGGEYNVTFTGGNHGYNNTGSGSTATARMTDIAFYADKRTISDGDIGYCSSVEIRWKNRVQGYNTKKADGTGREIIEVAHSAAFDSSDIKVSSFIYPLEDVTMLRYYGYQMPIENVFPKYRFYDSQNRLLTTFTPNTVSNSGDAVGYIFHAEDSSLVNAVEISIDPIFDLGRRQYIGSNPAMFVSGAGKFYFNIVRGVDVSMVSGSLYALKGAYKFAPAI